MAARRVSAYKYMSVLFLYINKTTTEGEFTKMEKFKLSPLYRLIYLALSITFIFTSVIAASADSDVQKQNQNDIKILAEPSMQLYQYHDWEFSFHEGLAAVRRKENGTWEYIDKTGRTMISLDAECSLAFDFYDGYAIIQTGNSMSAIRYGLIDKTGKTVIPAIYQSIFNDNGNFRVVLNNKMGVINIFNQVILPAEYDYIGHISDGVIIASKNEKYGAFDEDYNVIIPFEFEFLENFSNNCSIARKDDKIYPVDKTGASIFANEENNSKYDFIEKISDTLLLVNRGGYVSSNVPFFGITDYKGNIVIPMEYNYIQPLSDGLFSVLKENKWGYINLDNELIIPLIYDYAYPFVSGYGQVKIGDHTANTYKIIDKNGKTVMENDFRTEGDFTKGYALAIQDIVNPIPNEDGFYEHVGSKYGVVDSKGNIIFPIEYDYISILDSDVNNALFILSKGNTDILVNKSGKELIPRGTIEVYEYTLSGYVIKMYYSEKPSEYIYIDKSGNIITSEEYYKNYEEENNVLNPENYGYYDTVHSFSEGLAFVQKNEKWGIVEKINNTPIYTSPTNSPVYIDGKKLNFDAYNINGNNYFKLRDLAFVLTNTDAKFDVMWNEQKNLISIETNKPYTSVGGEMAAGTVGKKQAVPTSSALLFDGKEVILTAYTINGNNYFKLRDLASILNIGVKWNEQTNSIELFFPTQK